MKDPLSTHPSTVKPANTSGQGRLGVSAILVTLEATTAAETGWVIVPTENHAGCPAPGVGNLESLQQMDEARGSKIFTNGAHSLNAAAPQPQKPSSRGTDFATKSGKKKTSLKKGDLPFSFLYL